jgi:hypothetical protein
VNQLLAKNKPIEYSPEDWEKHWNGLTITFQALADTLKEMQGQIEKVDPKDFSLPNHYEKMVWAAAQSQMIDRILDLLPQNVRK